MDASLALWILIALVFVSRGVSYDPTRSGSPGGAHHLSLADWHSARGNAPVSQCRSFGSEHKTGPEIRPTPSRASLLGGKVVENRAWNTSAKLLQCSLIPHRRGVGVMTPHLNQYPIVTIRP